MLTKMCDKITKFKIPKMLIFMSLIGLYVFIEFLNILNKQEIFHVVDPNLKYILIWTNPKSEPIVYMGKGQSTFEKYHCPVNNCYVTSNKWYMKSLTDFHAIIFHGPELHNAENTLPSVRSPHQQYVFVSMESSGYYPIRWNIYNNFFNWTWSYKLNSDLYYGYLVIRNKDGDIIGPKQNMHWLEAKEMDPISDQVKGELSQKKLAAAWFVSNCKTPGKREQFAEALKSELAKYNMTLDIFGKCGNKTCSKTSKQVCNDLIKRSYYFYLSFENSFSEDYVTEKLLTALLNDAVPIVYGGANYTRFLPNGAYLNARELGVENLVQRMVDAINDNETYYEFFKWKNHYSYHYLEESPETNEYCKFCSKINDNVQNEPTVHEDLKSWWNTR